ncbi:3-deoxy-7-phosphoheptulonate synthase [Truepera radiovictrix]|uniref:Phospho-2-dehydro-3-deoxyheptonate aldolase n=1 Tax=Truepera radiovictrix (strain DSM 17093 / CIP 108686 / LMG 22925 / RQ-24) TaxID=649638 RepID=D7CU45_TRURR|nr:3-deoxy-7-phosphoheptulonate synthase [Truepera radiovictrix]ADI13943.1 phospho-2-dehydro-3-deoxyheptonate aldolase [Truepera radiovictrix DSM 17093]WMT57493.1 3-deoxy-7-phosphoheptulonate synthase [Truepera radiovictrix]
MKRVENLNVAQLRPLLPPAQLKRELPASERVNRTVSEAREAVRAVLRKREARLLAIVGPCSVHDAAAALEYAERLSALKARLEGHLLVIMRVYVDKPRTTVGWRGFVNDPDMDRSNDLERGLRRTRELFLKINELGLPVATEVLDPFLPQYLDDLIAWGAIGARTTESQTHRAMVSGLSMPVGFKNSTEGNVQVAVDAIAAASGPHTFLGIDEAGRAAAVFTTGNPDGHVILRGGRAGTNYDAASVAEAGERLRAAGLEPALIVDCSHHNSGYDHRRQALVWREVLAQRVAGNRDLVGLMLESNLKGGKQRIPENLSGLEYGVSVTDPCVGWETTAALLEEAHDALALAAEPELSAPR